MRQLEMKKKEKFMILWGLILMSKICTKIWEEKIHLKDSVDKAVILLLVLLVNFLIWVWEEGKKPKEDRIFFYQLK